MSEAHAVDNITVAVYDSDEAPDYQSAIEAEPTQVYRTGNATRNSFHEEIVAALDGNTPDLTIDTAAFGDSTLATSDVADGSPLGNELVRKGLTDTVVSGSTFTASVFIDSTEFNGLTLSEVSFIAEQSGGDLPVNRFLLDDPSDLLQPKEANESVTIDAEISVEDN